MGLCGCRLTNFCLVIFKVKWIFVEFFVFFILIFWFFVKQKLFYMFFSFLFSVVRVGQRIHLHIRVDARVSDMNSILLIHTVFANTVSIKKNEIRSKKVKSSELSNK